MRHLAFGADASSIGDAFFQYRRRGLSTHRSGFRRLIVAARRWLRFALLARPPIIAAYYRRKIWPDTPRVKIMPASPLDWLHHAAISFRGASPTANTAGDKAALRLMAAISLFATYRHWSPACLCRIAADTARYAPRWRSPARTQRQRSKKDFTELQYDVRRIQRHC